MQEEHNTTWEDTNIMEHIAAVTQKQRYNWKQYRKARYEKQREDRKRIWGITVVRPKCNNVYVSKHLSGEVDGGMDGGGQ